MKILAVFAHPDDEAFGPGGTLSRYSMAGHSVHLATMTHGEAGTLGPSAQLTRFELGRLRAGELRCSAKALQVSSLNIYDLPDGGLAELPAEQGMSIVRREVEAVQPDALITFHAGGISGHPDHQTVARWCRQVVREQAGSLRMFAYGLSSAQTQMISHRKLAPIPEAEITHIIDVSRFLEYKFEAIRCHRSQAESWERMQSIAGGIESFLKHEHFSQIWPSPIPSPPADTL
jgi:LmbE family N-acetylglucosaminyl deacetylase